MHAELRTNMQQPCSCTEHAIGSCDTNRVHAIGVLAAPKEVRRKWRHVFLLCQERAGLGPAPVPLLCAVEAPLAQGERGEAEQYHGHTTHDQVVRPRLAVSPAVALLEGLDRRAVLVVRAHLLGELVRWVPPPCRARGLLRFPRRPG